MVYILGLVLLTKNQNVLKCCNFLVSMANKNGHRYIESKNVIICRKSSSNKFTLM